MSMPPDEIDINPRSAEDVAGRLFVLMTMNRRLEIELVVRLVEGAHQYSEETDRFDLYSWAKTELASWISADELAVLKASAGKLTDEDISRHGTDLDAALGLGWALGIVASRHLSMAPVDGKDTNVDRVANWAPRPWDKARNKLKRLSLRSEDDLWHERERWFVYWLRASSDPDSALGLDAETIADLALDAAAIGLPARDGDLDFNGQRFEELSFELRSQMELTSRAFLHALTWVCGFGESWDDVPWDQYLAEETDGDA